MSDRTIELIRQVNPYPRELPPLPIDEVMRRLSADGRYHPAVGRRLPVPNVGGVMAAAAVVLALAIAVVAVTVVGHRRPATVAGSGSLKSLLAQYAVLRRPQTAADRALAGRAPIIGGTAAFGVGGGLTSRHARIYYAVRISGLSHYVAIPSMTRVVVAGGLRVELFVERYIRVTAPPKVEITGNDRPDAERDLRSWLRLRRRVLVPPLRLAGAYLLVVKVPGEQARPLSPLTGYTARILGVDPNAVARAQVSNASFPAPGAKIVAVEPDGVSGVKWAWPREWDAALLRYLPATSVSAPVSDNVAVAPAPGRFAGTYSIAPDAVTLRLAGGAGTDRYFDSNNAAAAWLTTSPGSSKEGPETPLSRAAERNPATPNRIFLVPSSVSLGTTRSGPGFQIEFRSLLNDASYYATITDEAGAPCVRPTVRGLVSYGAPLVFGGRAPTARGTISAGSLSVMLRCRGAYRVTAAVIGPRGRPYPPFGSATLRVR